MHNEYFSDENTLIYLKIMMLTIEIEHHVLTIIQH